MNAGILLLAAAASMVPLSAYQLSGCRLSAADEETYRRAVSSDVSFPERRSAFERLSRVCPDDPRLFAKFASLLIASRDFSAALSWADKGLKLSPFDGTLNLRKGEALVALSQGKEALSALAMTPETAESQFFRGLAYQLLEEHRPARQCFLDAWNRGHDDPYVLYSLMREDKDLGDKAAGVEHFKLMLARFPDSVWIHVLLGDAHFKMSELAEARQEYLTALKLMPDLFEPNFRLAYLAFEAGENTAAIEYYRHALALRPHHTEANIYLGEALRRDHRLPEAIAQLKRAIDLDPKVPLSYDSLSKAESDAGALAQAVSTLRDAEKQFPNDSSFPATRARILARMGKPEEAREAAARAREIMEEKLNKQASVSQ